MIITVYIHIYLYIYIYTNVVYLEDSAEKQLTLRLGNMIVQITKIDCNSLCNVQHMAYVVVCPRKEKELAERVNSFALGSTEKSLI